MTQIALRAFVVAAVTCALADTARCVPEDPPPAPQPPVEPPVFASRRKGSGDAKTDAAVKAALDWLSRHREPADVDAGRWRLDFGSRCKGVACGGEGLYWADGGLGGTSLALLAFLGAGETPAAGDYRAVVAAGLRQLIDGQSSDGCFGTRTQKSFLISHALSLTAVAEAYWATKDAELLAAATKGRDFLLAARSKDLGWRYDYPGEGDCDSYVTTTAMVALRTVELAGVEVPREAYDGGLRWFDMRTDEATGRVGYLRLGGTDARLADVKDVPLGDVGDIPFVAHILKTDDVPTQPMYTSRISEKVLERFPVGPYSAATAGAAASRALCRGDKAAVELASKALAAAPFKPDSFVDLHAATFGSLFFAQTGGGVEWRKAAVSALLASQRPATAGCAAGSWDPTIDPWGGVGGRVYATAMAATALLAPTRFPKVWDPKAKKPPPKKK